MICSKDSFKDDSNVCSKDSSTDSSSKDSSRDSFKDYSKDSVEGNKKVHPLGGLYGMIFWGFFAVWYFWVLG